MLKQVGFTLSLLLSAQAVLALSPEQMGLQQRGINTDEQTALEIARDPQGTKLIEEIKKIQADPATANITAKDIVEAHKEDPAKTIEAAAETAVNEHQLKGLGQDAKDPDKIKYIKKLKDEGLAVDKDNFEAIELLMKPKDKGGVGAADPDKEEIEKAKKAVEAVKNLDLKPDLKKAMNAHLLLEKGLPVDAENFEAVSWLTRPKAEGGLELKNPSADSINFTKDDIALLKKWGMRINGTKLSALTLLNQYLGKAPERKDYDNYMAFTNSRGRIPTQEQFEAYVDLKESYGIANPLSEQVYVYHQLKAYLGGDKIDQKKRIISLASGEGKAALDKAAIDDHIAVIKMFLDAGVLPGEAEFEAALRSSFEAADKNEVRNLIVQTVKAHGEAPLIIAKAVYIEPTKKEKVVFEIVFDKIKYDFAGNPAKFAYFGDGPVNASLQRDGAGSSYKGPHIERCFVVSKPAQGKNIGDYIVLKGIDERKSANPLKGARGDAVPTFY